MYTKLYPEMVSKSPTVEAIIRGVWELIGSGRLAGIAYDGVSTPSAHITLGED
jgi:exportin-2 (importin alpha re-exporter)